LSDELEYGVLVSRTARAASITYLC
jgi:hypothetical protein